ncbi:thiamine pyrophosphate-binding protein [Salinadaptatus halalkaliphilus]|uniref:Thiamine pyrophosphate-binding protein n=1 Tax=Salinadaptatus halalkaliphilus TaxID=2419781 RepID=A0A4S3TGY7_9EURY|nr:thiamine pyrophosphate-binding protein [Salinadaptatus halalkaliphilus]THE63209.1 thiamine pyrophosphate-binding protein [Salinadaptatus halalkaliphilus]
MNASDEIIDCLTRNGIGTIFGIPGKQTLPLNKSVSERDDIQFVMARHETNVSHQAWGYAETSGEMAATVVIPGPGDMNAMNGLKNALNDCTPLLHIAVETEPNVRGGDGIHETPPDTYDNVVKENVTVETPQSTVAELERAIEIARTPPTGPVRVGIPKDFVPADVEVAARESRPTTAPPEPPEAKIRTASERLANASSPVIVAGGGVRAANATEELLSVAESLDAPVATTYKGKGTVPEDHPLATSVLCGGASAELKACLENADAVLGVGTDFDAVWTKQWAYDLPAELIHVTLEPEHVGRGYEPSVAIVADAGPTLAMLEDDLAERSIASEDGESRARRVREGVADRLAELADDAEPPLSSATALEALREGLPRETIVTADAGGSRIWTLVSFPVYEPRDYVNPGSWASMGVGIGAAIGAKTANPDQPVAAFIGEGGLLMCLEELHTLVAEELDVTVFVFNNDDYAIISEEAERSYDLEQGEYGWADAPLDVATIAEGMGLRTERAETQAEIIDIARETLDTGPTLVEIPTDPYEPQAGEFMAGEH